MSVQRRVEVVLQPLQSVAQQWANYVHSGNPVTTNAMRFIRRLEISGSSLFGPPDKMRIDVISSKNSQHNDISQEAFCEIDLLRRSLYHSREASIYSICATNSTKPLNITAGGMESILSSYKIPLQFLDILFSFGKGSSEVETGSGSMAFYRCADGSFEMQYRLSYVEEVVGSSKSSWAIRQTALFHRYVPNKPGSLAIILHPKIGSIFQRRLETIVQTENSSRASVFGASSIHLLFLSSYVNEWRWYLQSLSIENERISEVAISYDFSKESNRLKGTDTIQDLHYLQERVLPIKPRIQSTLATIHSLLGYNELLHQLGHHSTTEYTVMLDELNKYASQCQEDLQSIELLEKRIQDVLSLLRVVFTLQNQATSTKISDNTLKLTKDTVDDSATVRVVTIVTLIYLPASFVATFLGMNLFTYQSGDKSGFMISHQFWIYVILTIPLTLVTVGAWWVVAVKGKSHRKQEQVQEKSDNSFGQV